MAPSNHNNLQEKIISWFWVVLFISTVLFLRWLLVEMHTETNRLSEESRKFQVELREGREESKELFQKFHAEMNEAVEEAINAINSGQIPSKYFSP